MCERMVEMQVDKSMHTSGHNSEEFRVTQTAVGEKFVLDSATCVCVILWASNKTSRTYVYPYNNVHRLKWMNERMQASR